MTSQEKIFWKRVLSTAPLYNDFDTIEASQVVVRIQEQIASGENSNILWAHLTQIVKQLQSGRNVIRRLNAQDSVSKLKVSKVDDIQINRNHPVVPPPSPIRKPSSNFCESNIQVIINTMERHKYNSKIQEKGCQSIVEYIKKGKTTRSKNARVVWRCKLCTTSNDSAICKVCNAPIPQSLVKTANADSRESQEIDSLGGLNRIIDALRNCSTDKKVATMGIFALAQLVHEDQGFIYKIASQGGIDDILHGMQLTCNDAEVQAQGLSILASPGLAEDCISRIDGKLFMDRVVDAFKKFPNSERLVAFACMALANLSMKLDEYAATLIGHEYQFHISIIELLKQKNTTPNIVASGLWTLFVLVRPKSDGSEIHHAEAMVHAQTIQVTISCMTNFPANANVQKNGRALLGRLGYEYSDSEKKLDGCQVQ